MNTQKEIEKILKRKTHCHECQYHDDGLCNRPTKDCYWELRKEKIHNTINSILAVIAMVFSIAVLLMKVL